MGTRKEPGPWSIGLDAPGGEEVRARKAVVRLYKTMRRPPPSTIIWLGSPMAGLLGHAYLHGIFGERLFEGENPLLIVKMMDLYGHGPGCDGNYWPSPTWSSFQIGRRLSSRARATAAALQRQAQELATSGLAEGDRVLASATVRTMRAHLQGRVDARLLGDTETFCGALPRLLQELGRIPGYPDPPRYVRTFDYTTRSVICSAKPVFELLSPRCIQSDQLAARLYEIENLARHIPAWFEPLAELVTVAGWLWPFDDVALLSAPPAFSGFDEDDCVHHESGPAITCDDGWSVWARHGVVVPSKAVRSPEEITPEDVLREPDVVLRRLLIEMRGPGLLDDPAWPEELRRLARMVFDLQYHFFGKDDLPADARLWPGNARQPARNETYPKATGLKDGVYYRCHPNGQLKLVAAVRDEKLVEWLRLDRGVAEGAWHAAGEGRWAAQQYYRDGRLEDFSPWDDSSKPYFTPLSFEQWVRDVLRISRKGK